MWHVSVTVEKQAEQHRYALIQDGEVIGVADYTLRDDSIVFVHTEIDEQKREGGMASQLVRAALDDVRETTELRVDATCSYVRHWLSSHPEYQELQHRTA